jgi:hypothetical protein
MSNEKMVKLVVRRDDNEKEATYLVNLHEQTVYELKELIAENHFGPCVEEQRLELKQRRLKNSHFLSHYLDARMGECILLILKLQSASSSSSNSSTPSASEDEYNGEEDLKLNTNKGKN